MIENIIKLINEYGIVDQASLVKLAHQRFAISLRDLIINIKESFTEIVIIPIDVNSKRKHKLLVMYSKTENEIRVRRLAKIQEDQLLDSNCKWLKDVTYNLTYLEMFNDKNL